MAPRRPYQDTAVSAYKTQDELDRLMSKYGVEITRWTMFPELIRFEFQQDGIGYRVDVPVASGYDAKDREQLRREKARVLLYYVKAKLTAAESGVADLHREFLPFMITGPDRVFFQEVEDAMKDGRPTLPLGADSPLLSEGKGDNP
jgi:hypothetical protein